MPGLRDQGLILLFSAPHPMLPRRGLLPFWSGLPRASLAWNRVVCPRRQLPPHRPYTSSSHDSQARPGRRKLVVFSVTGAGVAIVGLSLNHWADSSRGNSGKIDHQDRPLANVPFSNLFRSYIVYTCCSISLLVDCGPSIADWCTETSIPGIWPCFEYIIRHTFFKQFVGGETAEECLELTKEMSRNSLGAMLNYSAEVHDREGHSSNDKGDANSKLCIDKVKAIIHLIETSGRFIEAEETSDSATDRNKDSLMVAVKLSGLIKDASVLERASACLIPRELFSKPPTTTPPSAASRRGPQASLNIPTASLSHHDVESIKQLWTALQAIATSAKRNGNIRILIDAEHSWYQPAIDALFESCAQQFNAVPKTTSSLRSMFFSGGESSDLQLNEFRGPLIYNTLQAYLRRTPSYLAMSLERAKQGGYALGIKLVRGAYVEQENKEWSTKIVPTPPSHDKDHLASPVWPNKNLTDQCYNECADLLIREVARELHSQSKSNASFARLGLVLAGHNWISNMTAVQTMIDTGLAIEQVSASRQEPSLPPNRNLNLLPGVRGRIHFAQLYGMADDLTRALQQSFDNDSGGSGPHLVLKYIPYGDLRLVMPYLIRRAKENKSVMGAGGAQKERSVLAAEMRRRLWP